MILEESALDIVSEAVGEGKDKSWYINGIFAQAEVPNKNNRVYPIAVLEREVNLFVKNFIETKRAVGELSHPDSMEINPDRAAILIESLEKKGNDFVGRAKVLPTPCGKIVQGLLEGDVKVGVSTRGSGSLSKRANSEVSDVADDYRLYTIDVVLNPSAPDAIVDSIFESERQYQNLVESFLSDEKIQEMMDWRKKILAENRELKIFKNKIMILKQLTEKLETGFNTNK